MKITDEAFIKELEERVRDAMKSRDIDKILDATIAMMERLAEVIPEEVRRIRFAALEEAAIVSDNLGTDDVSRVIRSLKDKDTRTPTEGDLL